MAKNLSSGGYGKKSDFSAGPVQGIETGIAGFIGLAERGQTEGAPKPVADFTDFRRQYGGYLPENGYGEYRFLSYCVEHFFINGGSRCYVVRVAPEDAVPSKGFAPDREKPVLSFTAKNPGSWGDKIRIRLTPASRNKTAIVEVISGPDGEKYRCNCSAGIYAGDIVAFRDLRQGTADYHRVVSNQDNILELSGELGPDAADAEFLPSRFLESCEFTLDVTYEERRERYEYASLNPASPCFITEKTAESDLISVEAGEYAKEPVPPFNAVTGGAGLPFEIFLEGGFDGSAAQISAADFIGRDNGPGRRTGIQAFLDNNEVSLMAVPGVTDPAVQLSLTAHCEQLGSRFAVLDMPRGAKTADEIAACRELFDTSYAALYHPWLTVCDPLNRKEMALPPSGSILGIYARSDSAGGAHKAPVNEAVRACVGPDCDFGKGGYDILSTKGINLIRSFPGLGIRVWGARTASNDGSWSYISIRRLFIFIEASIRANTGWASAEPNGEALWEKVRRTIDAFLTGLWRSGSLAGTSTREAFFVNAGPDTMTQDDVDNGRLICVIGAAPVKPAEFVVLRISLKTGSSPHAGI